MKQTFTAEELAEMAAADAEIEAEFRLTPEDLEQSAKLDREAKFSSLPPEKRKVAEYQKAYYEANREKVAAQQKAYREANREKRRAYMREYMRRKRRMESHEAADAVPPLRGEAGAGLRADPHCHRERESRL